MTPDFGSSSLVLMKDEQVLYSSDRPGLRPLMDCVSKYMGKVDGCLLYDKVVGLAAARLIVFSKMITQVVTPVVSVKAAELLDKNKVKVKADQIAKNILNKEKSDVCPMEQKAMEVEDSRRFYAELKEIFS